MTYVEIRREMELKRERLAGEEGVSPPPSKRVNVDEDEDCTSPNTVIPSAATNIKITSRGNFISIIWASKYLCEYVHSLFDSSEQMQAD